MIRALIVCLTLSIQGFSQDTIPYQRVYFGPQKCYSRALLVVNNSLFIGASDGTIAKVNLTNNKVKNYISPTGFVEIRDIEQYQGKLVFMESSDSSEIYFFDLKKETFTASNLPRKVVFLDGIVNREPSLLALGDPINNVTQVYCYDGKQWVDLSKSFGDSLKTRAFFAASGTTFVRKTTQHFSIISGGSPSQYMNWFIDGATSHRNDVNLPLLTGATAGPYAHAYAPKNNNNIIAVGGDYLRQKYSDSTACFSTDGGLTWKLPQTNTGGYRSCVTFINDTVAIACGPTGSDISFDSGNSWKPFISGVFHASVLAKKQFIMTSSNGSVVIVSIKKILELR